MLCKHNAHVLQLQHKDANKEATAFHVWQEYYLPEKLGIHCNPKEKKSEEKRQPKRCQLK